MHRRLLIPLILLALGVTGCGVPDKTPPAAVVSKTSASKQELPASNTSAPAAIRLRAPSAGVDHILIPGELNEGVINPDRGDLMWFDGYDRVEPGHIGTAVVTAHVTYEGNPDVFSDLDDVAPGDPIIVGYADGSEATFAVTAAEVIDKTTVQSDPRVWGSQDDARRLVLMTCDDALGFRDDGHRNANLVVFASPISSG